MKIIDENTVPRLLLRRAQESPKGIAHYALQSNGEWVATTWEEFYELSASLAGVLKDLCGCEGQNIGVMASSSQNWDLFQMAVFMNGMVSVGIDPRDLDENIDHITRKVPLSGLLVENYEMLQRFSRETTDALRFIACVEAPSDNIEKVVSLEHLIQKGKGNRLKTMDIVKGPSPATIVFTSGSTGAPKGVCYTHEQLAGACRSILDAFPSIRPSSRFVCWLPLSNLFQRMINFCAISLGASTHYVEDPQEIMHHLPFINPHIFLGVPRFFEKLYEGIAGEIEKKPPWIRTLIFAALKAGDHMAKAKRLGKEPGFSSRILHAVLDGLVLKRLRAVLGNNISFMISGSAPMPQWLLERFHAMGLLILEAYGVSENVIPNALNRLEAYRFGTVGKPLFPNRVEIAADGEILVKGPGVFGGYFGGDNEEGDFNENGFLKTGDIGILDEDGFLSITGRKSEMFKTSTGRKIAPLGIEERLMIVPYVDQAVVLGAGKKYIVAILAASGLETESAGKGNCHESKNDDALFSSEMIGRIKDDVRTAIGSLPGYQKPAGLVLWPRPFSVAGGELTGNLKIKRSQVHKKFDSSVDALYKFLDSTEKSGPDALKTDFGTFLVRL